MTATAEAPRTRMRGGRILRRVGFGELGALRAVVGLVLICAIFQLQNSSFLTAFNITNLLLQVAATGLISIGVVYTLTVGEIDLSVGILSGLAAAVMAKLIVDSQVDPYLAIAAAILTGAALGLLQGFLFTRGGVPSFVVTLAGLLAWQGGVLYLLGDIGTINLTNETVRGIASTFLSDAAGWAMAVGALAVLAVVTVRHQRAMRRDRVAGNAIVAAVRFAGIAAVALIAVAVLNQDRGVPLAVLILLGFVVAMQYVLTRTAFGRHVLAIGGNAEAARRAGIRVNRVRVAVFGIAGAMAAVGGIVAASRLQAVTSSSGGSDLLLLAIAGPVIAGTSLFGGRGSVWSALLGALVIGAISNGMDLLAFEPAVKYMITGAVLLAAVMVDAASRRIQPEWSRT